MQVTQEHVLLRPASSGRSRPWRDDTARPRCVCRLLCTSQCSWEGTAGRDGVTLASQRKGQQDSRPNSTARSNKTPETRDGPRSRQAAFTSNPIRRTVTRGNSILGAVLWVFRGRVVTSGTSRSGTDPQSPPDRSSPLPLRRWTGGGHRRGRKGGVRHSTAWGEKRARTFVTTGTVERR